jgi:hypothetical protein
MAVHWSRRAVLQPLWHVVLRLPPIHRYRRIFTASISLAGGTLPKLLEFSPFAEWRPPCSIQGRSLISLGLFSRSQAYWPRCASGGAKGETLCSRAPVDGEGSNISTYKRCFGNHNRYQIADHRPRKFIIFLLVSARPDYDSSDRQSGGERLKQRDVLLGIA